MDSPSVQEIIMQMRTRASERNRAGMAAFGINTRTALGVSVTYLREIAKKRRLHNDHRLALALWKSNIHEARILASIVDDADEVDEEQMEEWVRGFDSWDVCDQVCSNLFDKTDCAHKKAIEWSFRKEEYVKRAGFALMAALAVHDKAAKDSDFLRFLPAIKRESTDERNFVRKAVNWTLRQIGKRADIFGDDPQLIEFVPIESDILVDTIERRLQSFQLQLLQLLAYHVAVARGANVDQPRNLAKSVTVE